MEPNQRNKYNKESMDECELKSQREKEETLIN